MSLNQQPLPEEGSPQPKREIQLNDQILFNKGNSLFIGRVVKKTEKAVRVDYDLRPNESKGSVEVVVYHFYAWIPISVLVLDSNGINFTVKKWYAHSYNGGHTMRAYILSRGRVVPI